MQHSCSCFRKMNLILITIDCLRADHLGCLGYSKKTTPNLDNLASGGVLFSQAISVGPGTPSSFKAMFTSTYPLMHGGRLFITDSRTTLAEVLKEHGYRTAAFHTNPWISSFYGYHKGFDTFDDGIQKWRVASRMSRPKALVQRILAKTPRLHEFLSQVHAAYITNNLLAKPEVLNRKAISWLHDNRNNFFLWIHYMDAHEPYMPPSRLTSPLKSYRILELHAKARNSLGSLSPLEINKLIDLYDTNISYIDEEISSLLRILEHSNILDNTFVIVTADHGQQFMERGHHGHGHYVYDEIVRVPLIITGPGLEGQVIGQQVSLLDLAPTILDMLKIEKPKSFLGHSLLPVITRGNRARVGDSEAISEADTLITISNVRAGIKPQFDANHRRISLRTGKWKYIYTEGGQDELYHLEDDPKETQNVIDIEPEMARQLRSRIMAHIEFEDKSRPGEEELIKAKIRKLKDSGKI